MTHDYQGAHDDLCDAYGCNEGQAIDKHWDAILHALTTMQEITSALPDGVDPVKLVQGLAELSEWQPIETAPRDQVIWIKGGRFDSAYSQIHGFRVHEQHLAFYVEKVNPDIDPPWTTVGIDPVNIKNPTHWMMAAPPAQLYREASEGAGE